jgi:hypothetical protein
VIFILEYKFQNFFGKPTHSLKRKKFDEQERKQLGDYSHRQSHDD